MTGRRRTALMLLAALMLLLAGGCHGSRGLEPFVMPEEFDLSLRHEIVFWAKNDTNKNQTRIYERAIADFEELYPNIDVNLRLYTDYGRIYNDVITNIATGTTPNVCITYPDHIATYLTGGNVVLPLDGLLEDERYGLGGSMLKYASPSFAEVMPQFMAECRINGHYYAVPFMRSTEACYVNKTYVEKLGYTLPEVLTWDFVWEVAEAAMAKDGSGNYAVNGQDIMIPFIYKSTDNMMIQMLRQHGGDYATAEGEVLIFNDTTRELLYTVAEHAESRAFSTFKISSYPANFLNAGQCIFAVDSTAGATWMGTDAPLSDISADKLVRFETAVMTVPQVDPAAPQMISQGPSVCVFNKSDSQEVLASWLFAQYLLTDGVQTAYSETEGYVPVTATAQNSAEYRDYLARGGEDLSEHYEVKIKAARLLLDNIGNTFVTPVYNGSASLRDAAGQMIEEVTKSVRRQETVDDEYIEQLYGRVNALYRLDQKNAAGGGAERERLGPLPQTAKLLLAGLAAIWAFIALYAGITQVKKWKNRHI